MEIPGLSVCSARSVIHSLAFAIDQHEQQAQVDDGAGPGHVSTCPVIPCQSLFALQRDQFTKIRFMHFLQRYLSRWPEGHPLPADIPVWNRCLVDMLLCVGEQYRIQFCCSTRLDPDAHASDDDSGDGLVEYRPAAFFDALGAYYRYAVDDVSSEGLCSAGHVTESPDCRSGLVRHLRDVIHLVDDWECDNFPDLLYMTEMQRDVWSLCVCFVTVGLVGLAVGSDTAVAWSRDMLAWCNSSEELMSMLHLPPEADGAGDGESREYELGLRAARV